MKNKLCFLLIALLVSLVSFAGGCMPGNFSYGDFYLSGSVGAGCDDRVVSIIKYNGNSTTLDIASELKDYEIVSIENGAFSGNNCGSVKSIIIPQSVHRIGYSAFVGCTNLDTIVVAKGNSVYDSRENCNAIIETTTNTLIVGCKNTIFPNGVMKIGDNAFKGQYLTFISIPNNTKTIGASAFQNCEYIEELVLGAGVEKIGENAFAGCPRIYSITNYADIAPTIEANTFADVSNNAELHVLANSVKRYKIYDYWGRFNILPIEAENTTNGNLSVRSSGSDAVFIWPVNNNADSYTLTIKKGDTTFCTLIFNGDGQLTNITFAPARNGERHIPAAELTTNGYRFTVTGLEVDAHYTYQIIVKDWNDKVLNTYKGEFSTNSTAIDNIAADNNIVAKKYIRNGQIVIQRGDKAYTTTGIEIK